MKKIVLAMLAVCVSGPILAQETPAASPRDGRPAMEQFRHQGHEAFTKANKEQMDKIKAKEAQMAKLVKEYKGLKEGKKKDAKFAEIKKEVVAIRDEQLKFKQDQLDKFEKRLATMREDFAKENTVEAKEEWANKKTEKVIENDGNLRGLFGRHAGGRGPQMNFPKDKKFKKGPRRGWFGKKGPRMEDRGEKRLPPPPDAELPVQRPVEK